MQNQQLYINDQPITAPYAQLPTEIDLETPVTLAANEYYLVRNFYDETSGTIISTSFITPRREIVGTLRWRIYPFDRAREIDYGAALPPWTTVEPVTAPAIEAE